MRKPITVFSIALFAAACASPEEREELATCIEKMNACEGELECPDDAMLSAMRAEKERYEELYNAAKHYSIDEDQCNSLRKFFITQLEGKHGELLTTEVLLRFEVSAFMGICLIHDDRNDLVYEVTDQNVRQAMYLDKEGNMRIPPMKVPQ